MSDSHKSIGIVIFSCALFIILGTVFDRDLFLALFTQTNNGSKREKEKVLASIRAYDDILADLYASGGIPKMLNEFPATKSLRHQLFRDIGFIRDTGRVLVYDLATITPVDVSITSHNTAEAVVFEEWNYLYQRKDSREAVSSIKGLGQGFKYRLIKERGAWLVSAWDPVTVAEPLKKGK